MMDRAERRALELTRSHGIAQKNVTGAYPYAPLRGIEFLFHEVAHWVTLGQDIKKIPRRLSHQIGERFKLIAPASANALEIDTSLVAYLVGWSLGYWKDPSPIVTSCRRNLTGRISLMGADGDVEVYRTFTSRWRENRGHYVRHAVAIAYWFRPSVKLLTFPAFEFPGPGV